MRYITVLRFRFAVIVIAACLWTFPTIAQWQHMSGPGMTSVRCIYINDSILIVGGFGGMYRSTDGGTSWPKASDTVFSQDGRCMLVRQDTLYYGMSSRAVARSTDVGATWRQMPTSATTNVGVLSLLDDDNRILAGSFAGSLFTLTDTIWLPYHPEFREIVFSLVSDGGMLYAGTDNDGAFYSNDHGVTWIRPITAPSGDHIRALIASGPIVLCGSAMKNPYRSTDYGRTWATAPIDSVRTYANTYIRVGDMLFAGTTIGCYKK